MTLQIHETKLDFATVVFFKTYVLCKITQGASIGIKEVVALHKLYRDYFGTERYGYIFDRTDDFTIDPISYIQCPYYPDVTAFAIVAPNLVTKRTVQFEEKFSKMKLKTFDTLEEAQQWMEVYNNGLGI